MGQYFLRSREVLAKILASSNLTSEKAVLEIGAGTGVLTTELARRVKRVVAVEKDERLAKALAEKLEKEKVENVRLIAGDILKISWQELNLPKKYSVAANIPYYLTSRLIRVLLENKNPPEEIHLMVQKEVAERITAHPPKMNLLAVSVQVYARPKIAFNAPKNAFSPSPKVNSAFVSITAVSPRKFREEGVDEKLFFKILHAAFQSKRKTLANSLADNLGKPKSPIIAALDQAGVNPALRPENLAISDWFRIAKFFRDGIIGLAT